MYKSIIPECYIDTCLINVLLNAPDKKGVNHGKGNSSVTGKMKSYFKDEFSVGILDKDENDIEYIRTDFSIINNTISDYAMLYKHNTKHHYIIQICPVSESWICNVSKMIGVNLVAEHNIPDEPKKLKILTKKVSSKYDPAFISLFKSIVKKSEEVNFEPVLKLKSWLRILVDNNYQVDINELQR